MKHLYLFVGFFISFLTVSSQSDSIFIKIDSNIKVHYSFYSHISEDFLLVLTQDFIHENEKDLGTFMLNVFKLGNARDSNSLSHKNIYTPEMIMDSLTKYRFDYERKNRGRFYVILKGQGPIWYLHKATLTYLWSDPGSFNIRKKKGNEMFVTRQCRRSTERQRPVRALQGINVYGIADIEVL